MRTEIVNGIVLYNNDYLDYDKIAVVYTEQYGKIKVFFKSVNKPEAKLRALVQPVTEVELVLLKLSDEKFYDKIFKVIGGEVINYYLELKKNLAVYSYVCKVLDLVDALTYEFSVNRDKFLLLRRMLEVIKLRYGKLSETDKLLLFMAFVYRFIKLCGYMPNFNFCARCKKNLVTVNTKFFYFDFKNKEAICDNCTAMDKEGFRLSVDTVITIQKFYKLSSDEILKQSVSSQVCKELELFTFMYLQDYIHRPLKTWQPLLHNNLQ